METDNLEYIYKYLDSYIESRKTRELLENNQSLNEDEKYKVIEQLLEMEYNSIREVVGNLLEEVSDIEVHLEELGKESIKSYEDFSKLGSKLYQCIA